MMLFFSKTRRTLRTVLISVKSFPRRTVSAISTGMKKTSYRQANQRDNIPQWDFANRIF
jgi:hypothetical protein